MKKICWLNSCLILVIIFVLCCPITIPAIETSTKVIYPLPPPLNVDMNLELSISRRMSVREFTEEPITDEDLSTILWTSYGIREDKSRTVPPINGNHSAVIYVLKEEATYIYDPENHSLVLFRTGDYRDIVGWQYQAPIQLGIAWDTDKNSNEYLAGAEIGEIGQNIYFAANAMNLGTVVTAERPSPLDQIDLPTNHVGRVVLPIGHPQYPYDFVYKPRWISFLPRIMSSQMSISEAIIERNVTTIFEGDLTRQEISQMIWASYGYSYMLDKSKAQLNPIKRHRTIPSAHGYYPLRIYAITENGVYRYIPGVLDYDKYGIPIISLLLKIGRGDKRGEIALASQSFISSAPLILVSVLDVKKTNQWDDLSSPEIRWIWYYEAGASAQNILLEATAWDLSSNIVTPIDENSILSVLRLNEDFIPLFIVPIGK